MELKYVVLMIIKILISVPVIILYQSALTNGAALMGGHLDNKNSSDIYLTDYDIYDEINNSTINRTLDTAEETSSQIKDVEDGNEEKIPNPSPLVLPGYNLPENIFNKGKPFYLERDPLTGKIDFDSKASAVKLDDDLYDYVEDEPSSNIYDKSNIDRKDGSLSSHRPSDVNQLTPNFHDFLHLPVKYNSDKYVYPLISSSYANTKIQGNVNKYYNHKNYNQKTSTFKPTRTPTYYSSTYFNPPTTTISTTTPTTTTPRYTTAHQIFLTTTKPLTNLMNSGMNHPSFHEEFEYDEPTKRPNEIFLTTENVNNIYLTTKASTTTTTKKVMSLFEQLFGDYDEPVTTTDKTKPPPPLFANLPSNKNTKNKYESEIKTEKPSYATPDYPHYPNSHAGPNVLSGTHMGIDSNAYEYEEDYGGSEAVHTDNIAVESNPITEKRPTDYNITISTSPVSTIHKNQNITDYIDYETEDKENLTNYTEIESTTVKVTSLPLGENHLTNLNNHQPIIVATQNIREQLNNEKVIPKPFEKGTVQHAPSKSNIHIAPDQDTVSFVVGNQQNVEGGQYIGTALKESPYDSNPFRPLYGQPSQINQHSVSYTIQDSSDAVQNYPEIAGSSVTIQPQKHSEAALAIGVPVGVAGIKQKPGQVVDETFEINKEKVEFPKDTEHNIEFPKGTGQKVVFPDEKESSNLVPPPQQSLPLPPPPQQSLPLPPPPQQPPSSLNREVLKLNSQPMYHQLPSDLTPPKEQDLLLPPRKDRPRPPWDPRPGHFHSGKPEYVRPPRPPPEIAYKRIDNLPNILPQFRPNTKANSGPHYFDNRLNRQPLLDRPSNRPIGFFEKLLPPPPPKNLNNLRKIPPPPSQNLDPKRPIVAEDRIINEPPLKQMSDQFDYYHPPPKVVIANRRIANIEGDVETLQMIQAKQSDKKEVLAQTIIPVAKTEINKNNTEKPLYVVYPVNTPPIKLDVIENNKKESVVIGTRAELPLPPSKINQDFSYEQNPILNPKDRHDSPILKPHPRPPTFPVKSDFPYPLERPDPVAIPETPSKNGNNLDDSKDDEEINFLSSNQWNSIGGEKTPSIKNNQISATLKTYTEKPIAVAFTPTEPNDNNKYLHTDKYSMPNYASPVIPEIRPGTVDDVKSEGSGNEFTVSAVMHTFPQLELNKDIKPSETTHYSSNHRIDEEVSNSPPPLDFQAPFQASVNIDSKNQGWSVVRNKNKVKTDAISEVTTLPLATTSEFDIENFKPELIGGFKPIYNLPNDDYVSKHKEDEINERQER